MWYNILITKFCHKGGTCMKKPKSGITTGACAALCAYGATAAAIAAKSGAGKLSRNGGAGSLSRNGVEACLPRKAGVYNPRGILIEGEISPEILPDGRGRCSTVKYSGDDPDVTDGVRVVVTAELLEDGIIIEGGDGIGRVTKPGLDRPPGDWAINSGPRRMIEAAVEKAASEMACKTGARITVEIPGGGELAKRTFNPRLGIEGGLSVLGTDGILRPMSTAAIVDTIRAELSVKRASGVDELVLCPGRTGETAAAHAGIPPERIAQCSNFIGDAVDMAAEFGFSSVIVAGHIGKLVKLGSGIFNTHSHTADGRIETLAACGAFAGVDLCVLRQLDDFITADAAVEYLQEQGVWEDVSAELGRRSDRYLAERAGIKSGVMWFSGKNTLLGLSSGARRILERE